LDRDGQTEKTYLKTVGTKGASPSHSLPSAVTMKRGPTSDRDLIVWFKKTGAGGSMYWPAVTDSSFQKNTGEKMVTLTPFCRSSQRRVKRSRVKWHHRIIERILRGKDECCEKDEDLFFRFRHDEEYKAVMKKYKSAVQQSTSIRCACFYCNKKRKEARSACQ